MYIEKKPSPNYGKGRNGWKPDMIVCHITEGSFAGSVSWLCNPQAEASTHFVVSKTGEVVQLVDLENTAWGNVTSTYPGDNSYYGKSAIPAVRERRTDANYYTISIEHEGFSNQGAGALTIPQLNATIELMKHIRKEVKRIYGIDIPIDRNHIVGHYQLNAVGRPNCPGKNFPWKQIIDELKGESPTPVKPTEPVDVLAPFVGTTATDIQDWFWGKGKRDNYCAAAVSYALTKVGVSVKEDWVDDLIDFYKKRGAYHTRESGYIPKKNDTIFFDYEPNGYGNHVGFVKYQDGTRVYTREGNANDMGITKDLVYGHSDKKIMGYGEWEKIKPQSASVPPDKAISIAKELKGYGSVENLKKDTGAKPVISGDYFIYKESEGFTNVTKTKGIPGAWVNLKTIDSGAYRVQLGYFKDKKNADDLVRELKEKGYEAIIKED